MKQHNNARQNAITYTYRLPIRSIKYIFINVVDRSSYDPLDGK